MRNASKAAAGEVKNIRRGALHRLKPVRIIGIQGHLFAPRRANFIRLRGVMPRIFGRPRRSSHFQYRGADSVGFPRSCFLTYLADASMVLL